MVEEEQLVQEVQQLLLLLLLLLPLLALEVGHPLHLHLLPLDQGVVPLLPLPLHREALVFLVPPHLPEVDLPLIWDQLELKTKGSISLMYK